MGKRILLAALSVLVLMTTAAAKNNDIELLRKRFQTEAMAPPVDADRVRQLMETINPDGTWPGIDYVDTARIAFQHTDHLNNLVAMALHVKGDRGCPEGVDSRVGLDRRREVKRDVVTRLA